MSFQDGPNRPPRRQSAKNIDFRRLADVNNEDDVIDGDSVDATLSATFASCQICRKLFDQAELDSLVRTLIRILVQ